MISILIVGVVVGPMMTSAWWWALRPRRRVPFAGSRAERRRAWRASWRLGC